MNKIMIAATVAALLGSTVLFAEEVTPPPKVDPLPKPTPFQAFERGQIPHSGNSQMKEGPMFKFGDGWGASPTLSPPGVTVSRGCNGPCHSKTYEGMI